MSAPLRPRPAAPHGPAASWDRAVPGARATSRLLTVGVVGAGRVGTVLGAALAAAGHRVVAVSGSSGASRARLALLLPEVPRCPVAAVAHAAADLLLIAVPDDTLAGVVTDLAERARCIRARSSRTPPERTAWPCWGRPWRPAPGRSPCTPR